MRERREARLAVASINELRYPFCCVAFTDFKAHGKLRAHEDLRDAMELRFFDTWQRASDFGKCTHIVFVSHQV